jgi:peptidoglycan/LPS O-acetylase OafA/YrhL
MALEETSGKSKNLNLQWLRGLAAFSVLLYHSSIYLSLLRNDGRYVEVFSSLLGRFGVMMFFAISGYLMASAMRRQDPETFILHRVARIYPPFFVAVALYALVAGALGLGVTFDALSLSLMPYGKDNNYPLAVEWTLVFEVSFYVFVFALMYFKMQKVVVTILAGWLCVILAMNLYVPDPGNSNVYAPYLQPFASANIGFALGMLIPFLPAIRIHPVLATLIAINIVLLLGQSTILAAMGGLGVGCALILASLVVPRDHSSRGEFSILALLCAKIGDYSYALYLCHVPVIKLVYLKLPQVSSTSALVSAISLSLLVAAGLGVIDLRLYRVLKGGIDRASGRVRQVAAAIFVGAFCAVTLYSSYVHMAEARLNRMRAGILQSITSRQSINNAADAAAAAAAAGFVPAEEILGHLDKMQWGAKGGLHLSGWIADRSEGATTPFLVVFAGRQASIIQVDHPRNDVAEALNLPSLKEQLLGFGADVTVACVPSSVLTLMVMTSDRRFAFLSSGSAIGCRP